MNLILNRDTTEQPKATDPPTDGHICVQIHTNSFYWTVKRNTQGWSTPPSPFVKCKSFVLLSDKNFTEF